MLRSNCATALGTIALALTLSLGAASVQAASACKGMEAGPCQANDNCSWVKSYKRKDGVEVSGHCKSKSGKSSGTKSKSDRVKTAESKKKTDSKKAESKKSETK